MGGISAEEKARRKAEKEAAGKPDTVGLSMDSAKDKAESEDTVKGQAQNNTEIGNTETDGTAMVTIYVDQKQMHRFCAIWGQPENTKSITFSVASINVASGD